MQSAFHVENGKIIRKDPHTGQLLAEWSPIGTSVVEVILVEDAIVVREDPRGFPPDKSNVYALDETFRPLWTADRPEPSDVYTHLAIRDGRLTAVSRSGCRCTLGQMTGAITSLEKTGRAASILPDNFYPDLAPWKNFFGLAGGSILYCLSAMLILYGIVKIMGPILATSFILTECLPGIGTLNLYELALLGVLVAIVVWRHVTDDAVSLVVLIVLFLMANGIALDTVSPGGPRIVLYLGAVCFVLGVAKLAILKKFILTVLSTPSLITAGVILLWNFVGGPLMGFYRVGVPTNKAYYHRDPWLLAWLVVLAAAGAILVEAALKPTRTEPEKPAAPFLHTPLMGQLFLLLVLAAAGMHLYALAYLFNFDYAFGDFIPLICLGALFVVEILRYTGRPLIEVQVFTACLPLAALVFGILGKSITASAAWNIQILWYPPILFGLTGAAILGLAWRHPRPALWYVAGLYAVGVILTAGFSPEHPYDVNWQFAGGTLILMLLGLGIWYRNAYMCLIGGLIAAIALGTSKPFAGWMAAIHVNTFCGVLGLVGLAMFLAYLAFPRQLAKEYAVFGAAMIIFLFDFVPDHIQWQDLPAAAAVLVLCGVLRLRTRDLAPIVVLCTPLAWRSYIFSRTMSAWGYVALSFLLLAAGAWASFHKGKRQITLPQNNDHR